MTHRYALALLLAPASLVAGCMGTENRGLESVHQPIVSRQDYVLDLTTSGGALPSGEQRRLSGWLETMRLGYGDRVSVDDAGAPAGRAREQVAGVVASYGVILADGAPVIAAPIAPGTVRVVFSRMRADVPGCPDWSRSQSREYNSNTSSNLGCSNNTNLAAMIADPGDLVRGRSGSGIIDPLQSTKAIDAYRRRTTTGASGAVQAQSTGGK